MIFTDIAILEAIAARLKAAGGAEASLGIDRIQAVLDSKDSLTEESMFRLLHGVWRCVSFSLDRESHRPGREVDLEKLESELNDAIDLLLTPPPPSGSLPVREETLHAAET
jgi:hypothetical protein